VSIRNVQWTPLTAASDVVGLKMGAGCGVIAESLLDREWCELCAKLDCIQEITGL
jgi:isochorismate synthase EntC